MEPSRSNSQRRMFAIQLIRVEGSAERLAAVERDGTTLARQLREFATGSTPDAIYRGRVEAGERPQVALLFSGQGDQYPGMGRELFDQAPLFRQTIERCADLLRDELPTSLLEVMYPSEGRLSPLDDTRYTQPALFALQYALHELWRSWGVTPDVVLGHSVGEYAAACAAGVLHWEDGLRLVAARARWMHEGCRPGTMAVVFADEDRVMRAIAAAGAAVSVAAVNRARQVVVAGEEAELGPLLARWSSEGLDSHRLPVSHAFHSPLVEPMLGDLASWADRLEHRPTQCAWISSATGQVLSKGTTIERAYWCFQTRNPVRFVEAAQELKRRSCDVHLELGPGSTLIRLCGEAQPAAQSDGPRPLWTSSLLRGQSAWSTMLNSVARAWVEGVAIDWTEFDRPYNRRRVATAGYPFRHARATPAPQPADTEARDDLPLSEWMHHVQWEPLPPAENDRTDAAGWLVVSQDANLATAVAERIRAVEQQPAIVMPPVEDEAAYEPAWTRWAANDKPLGIVYLVDATPSAETAEREVRRLAALWHCATQQMISARIYVATRGAQRPPTTEENSHTWAGTIWALMRSARQEVPRLRVRLIDLSSEGDSRESAECLIAELATTSPRDEVAIRKSGRWSPRLVPCAAPLGSQQPVVPRTGGTYLITGGLGALGLETARWLAQAGRAKLVLISRTQLPPAETWQALRDTLPADDPLCRRLRALVELQQSGAAVQPVCLDVADREALTRLVAEIRARDGQLAGVVHAAGITRDGLFSDQTPERIAEVWRPKVLGAQSWWKCCATCHWISWCSTRRWPRRSGARDRPRMRRPTRGSMPWPNTRRGGAVRR